MHPAKTIERQTNTATDKVNAPIEDTRWKRPNTRVPILSHQCEIISNKVQKRTEFWVVFKYTTILVWVTVFQRLQGMNVEIK